MSSHVFVSSGDTVAVTSPVPSTSSAIARAKFSLGEVIVMLGIFFSEVARSEKGGKLPHRRQTKANKKHVSRRQAAQGAEIMIDDARSLTHPTQE